MFTNVTYYKQTNKIMQLYYLSAITWLFKKTELRDTGNGNCMSENL